jgi:hypothetical protein
MHQVAKISGWGQWLALGGVALLTALIGERVGISVGDPPVRTLHFPLAGVALLALLLFTAVRAVIDDAYAEFLLHVGRRVLAKGAMLWVGLALWAALSITWARVPSLAVQSSLLLVMEVALAVVLAGLAVRYGVAPVAALFVIAALPHALIAIAQTAAGGPIGLGAVGEMPFNPDNPFRLGPQPFRPYALATHPNVLAGYLVLALLQALLLAYTLRDRVWLSVAAYAAMAVLYAGLVVTQSRMALVIATGLLLPAALIAYRPRGRALWLTLGVIGVGGAGAVVFALTSPLMADVVQRFRELASSWQGVVDRVFYAFPNTLIVFQNDPVRGVGLYNLTEALRYIPPDAFSRQLPAHNVYLVVLAELGVIGGVLYALGLWVPLRGLWTRHGGQFIAGVALLAFSVMILFEYYFWSSSEMRMLTFWLLGTLWGLQVRNAGEITVEGEEGRPEVDAAPSMA